MQRLFARISARSGVGLHGCTRFRGEVTPLPHATVLREEISPANSSLFEGGEDLFLIAAGEATQEDASVLGLPDMQVWGVAVVVGGAEGPVLSSDIWTTNDFENIQHAL